MNDGQNKNKPTVLNRGLRKSSVIDHIDRITTDGGIA